MIYEKALRDIERAAEFAKAFDTLFAEQKIELLSKTMEKMKIKITIIRGDSEYTDTDDFVNAEDAKNYIDTIVKAIEEEKVNN